LKPGTALIFLLALLPSVMQGQNGYAKSFGFISDNDLYISINQDQYYTNGLTFTLRFLPKDKPSGLLKQVFVIDFGQYMYTPSQDYMVHSENQDRPFAGYLFAGFSMERYYTNRGLFKMVFQIGVVGKASQAESLQEWVHTTLGLPQIDGWEYQIHNQLGLNANFLYFRNIGYTPNRTLDFNLFAQAKVGTVFDEAGLGFVSRIGIFSLHLVDNTILLNSNLNTEKTGTSNSELFIFVKPELTFVAYDATIQGSLFNDNSPLTFKPNPFVASVQIGLKWASRRFNVGYALCFLSKPIDNDKVKPHKYGSIMLVYRFN